MNNFGKLLLAVAATAVITPQLVSAHDHHRNRGWNNNNGYYTNQAIYPNNYGYRHRDPYVNGVRTRNGSYVDGSIGANGNPAWMGGYTGR